VAAQIAQIGHHHPERSAQGRGHGVPGPRLLPERVEEYGRRVVGTAGDLVGENEGGHAANDNGAVVAGSARSPRARRRGPELPALRTPRRR